MPADHGLFNSPIPNQRFSLMVSRFGTPLMGLHSAIPLTGNSRSFGRATVIPGRSFRRRIYPLRCRVKLHLPQADRALRLTDVMTYGLRRAAPQPASFIPKIAE